MRDLKTTKEDNLKRIELAIIVEVAGLEEGADLTRLLKLANNYRKQVGIIRGNTSPTSDVITGHITHKGVC